LRANGEELSFGLRFLSLWQQVLEPDHPLFPSRLPVDLLLIGMSLKAVCADLKELRYPAPIGQGKRRKRRSKKTGAIQTLWIKNNDSSALERVRQPLPEPSSWGKESRTFTVKPLRRSKRLRVGKTAKLFCGKSLCAGTSAQGSKMHHETIGNQIAEPQQIGRITQELDKLLFALWPVILLPPFGIVTGGSAHLIRVALDPGLTIPQGEC